MTAPDEADAGPVATEQRAADDLPDLTTLLGLRSPKVAASIIVLAVGYVAILVGTTGADTAWGAQYLALALALFAIVTAVLVPGDRLPLLTSAGLAGAGLIALGVAWWHIPPETEKWWVVASAPPAMTAVLAGLIALRGRAVVAWLTLAGAMAVAAAWGIENSASSGLILPMTNRILGTVLPATIIVGMIRPMMNLLGALREREVTAVREQAAADAVLTERADRLEAIAREAGPILEMVAEGRSLTQEQALAARLLEHTLRDEVRGRGWDSEGVRQAAAAARARGVAVSLFDDGGLADRSLSAEDAERLRGELIRRLAMAKSGAVTARILPPGREEVAVITVSDGDRVDRRSCVATPAGLRWV